MQRLAQFDVSRQFLTPGGKLGAQVTFGLVCGAAMVGVRELFSLWAPTSGPFALVYPTVLLATLYGHWRAGVVALMVTFLWAWIFVLPAPNSLTFVDPSDPPRVLLNAVSAGIVIVFAEAFRRAARSTVDQIREAADRRLTLLAELEHRTKNNFALVASLLEIHKRRLNRPELDGPIDDAVGRVRTFADAYSNIALEQEGTTEIAIRPYLDQLLNRIESAALPPNVDIFREIDEAIVPREAAVAIGLYVNEAVSNCAKYAFPDGRPGTIAISFLVEGEGWHLTVEDNGAGVDADSSQAGGLGSRLMIAFAAQADATHNAGPVLNGYRTEMRFVERAEA